MERAKKMTENDRRQRSNRRMGKDGQAGYDVN